MSEESERTIQQFIDQKIKVKKSITGKQTFFKFLTSGQHSIKKYILK